MRPCWFPDWSEAVCAIVASGPSVRKSDVKSLRGRCRVAVVNHGVYLAPWADLLYAADARWWASQETMAKSFCGLRVTPDDATAKRLGLHVVSLLNEHDADGDRFVFDRPGIIARGGNSGFQLVNLVAQFGCRRQIWIGFDFTGEHWHGRHAEPLRNPRQRTLDKWRVRFDANADVLRCAGIEVILVSPLSKLTKYRRVDCPLEALAEFRC